MYARVGISDAIQAGNSFISLLIFLTCRYIGYDIATFIVESLVHSAHVRDPAAIMEHAGYYGYCHFIIIIIIIIILLTKPSFSQAVKEISTCLATFIVPVVLNYVTPKVKIHMNIMIMISMYFQWTLVIGSSLFACYFACFFFINNVIYFLANIILGIAFARNILEQNQIKSGKFKCSTPRSPHVR